MASPSPGQVAMSGLKNAVAVSDGTVAGPSVSFSNDPNTGIYRPGADVVGVVTGGVERMRVDAAGNVGIGTATPTALVDIVKDGVCMAITPVTSGQYTLVKFNSRVNFGSDYGFILVQDESANAPGTSSEDLRMTIGVTNDFKQSASHSDELWLQGGGRLCYNAGSWDSELNTIIGTPNVGTVNSGPVHEWRVNNAALMTLHPTNGLSVNTKLNVTGTVSSGGYACLPLSTGSYGVGTSDLVWGTPVFNSAVTLNAGGVSVTLQDAGIYMFHVKINSDFNATGILQLNSVYKSGATWLGWQSAEDSRTWDGASELLLTSMVQATAGQEWKITLNNAVGQTIALSNASSTWSRWLIYKVG